VLVQIAGVGAGESDGTADGAADGATDGTDGTDGAHWPHDLPHTEETFPFPSLRLLLHLSFVAHHLQSFFRLMSSSLNFPFLVLVAHDLPHTEETRPPPSSSAILRLHLFFFAHPLQSFFRLMPSSLNFPVLVLVQIFGASASTPDGAADVALGTSLKPAEGSSLTLIVGAILRDGIELGTLLSLGELDGELLGESLGEFDGELLGASVGELVVAT